MLSLQSMGRRADLSAYNGEEPSNVPSEEQPMETDHTTPISASDHMEVGEVEEQLDPKTVTSLEQFLSNLPAEQMTELLQSTPPTQTSGKLCTETIYKVILIKTDELLRLINKKKHKIRVEFTSSVV